PLLHGVRSPRSPAPLPYPTLFRSAFAFVSAHQATYPVATMCRVLEVSTSGYYAWRKHQPSERDREDAALTERIRIIHAESYGTYGAPRVHAELREQGVHVGRKRVARLMRQARLQGASRRRGTRTTVRKRGQDTPPDQIGRAH